MRKIYLFQLVNMVLITTITLNLCGRVSPQKIPALLLLQHSIYKAKPVLHLGVSWCGNLQLKNRFE